MVIFVFTFSVDFLLFRSHAIRPISRNRGQNKNWIFWVIIMQIYEYFAISKLPGAKISLSNGNFDQIWPNCYNFLNMLRCEMDRQFHVRVLFWPLLGLFSSFKHNQFKNVVPNSCKKFLAIFGFQKTPKLSLDSAECQNFHFRTFWYILT